MAVKVLHLRNLALLGRYPKSEITRLFAEHDVDYRFDNALPNGAYKDHDKIIEYCNREGVDWVFWNWEKHELQIYKQYYESRRSFKIALFGHEQPQALDNLRAVSQYADFTITSSPVYKNEVDGFLPFGIHTHFFEGERLPFKEKANRILLSGSYRHSRGQFFEWALREQPFKWPVYLFTPPLSIDTVERDYTRQICARYPRYVYKCAENRTSYISQLLAHLNTHKIFLDFTTNSTNKLKFHEDFEVIMKQARELNGGYCPERVLDALWLGTYSWCLYDKAVTSVLQDQVGTFESCEDLVEQVNQLIIDSSCLRAKAQSARKFVSRYTTEEVIRILARFFKTGHLEQLC